MMRREPVRKLTKISIDEISGVTDPAHNVPGWIVKKSAEDGADLPLGAIELDEREQANVSGLVEQVPAGSQIDFPEAGDGAVIGKSAKGKVFLRTPASIEKARGNAWAESRGVGNHLRNDKQGN